jgi:hypothetical protein
MKSPGSMLELNHSTSLIPGDSADLNRLEDKKTAAHHEGEAAAPTEVDWVKG